jgi:hypothetical protein
LDSQKHMPPTPYRKGITVRPIFPFRRILKPTVRVVFPQNCITLIIWCIIKGNSYEVINFRLGEGRWLDACPLFNYGESPPTVWIPFHNTIS